MIPLHPSLRPARPADLAPVRRLLADAGLPIDDIEESFGDGYVVAELDGRVVGLAGLEVHGPFGFLRSVAVSPDLKSGGIGRVMALDRIEHGRRLGLDAIYLLTMSAAAYFRRLGFEDCERSTAPAPIRSHRQFTSSCPASATLMKLTITGAAGR